MSLSPNAQFNLQSTGSNNGLWGVNLNGNFSIADGLLGGRATVSCAGSSNIIVSTSQSQNVFQILTGALTGNILYILPAVGGFFYVTNTTTGAYTVTVVNTALGTGVIVPQGTSQLLFSNPDNATVSGILPTALSLSALSLSGQLTSTLSTGTAPFVVASTTPVANLSIGGNAATSTLASTVTTNANLTGMVTSVGNATTVVTNANLTGPITSTGNAVAPLTAYNVLLGAGSGAIAYAAPSTAGQALVSNGSSANPTFQNISGIPVVSTGNPWKIVTGAITKQGGEYTSGSSGPTISFGTSFSGTPYTIAITNSPTTTGTVVYLVTSSSSSSFTAVSRNSSSGGLQATSFYWEATGPT